MYIEVALERCEDTRLLNIQYVQQYCRSDEAAGEQSAQCLVVARSSLAQRKMLHAGLVYMHAASNTATSTG